MSSRISVQRKLMTLQQRPEMLTSVIASMLRVEAVATFHGLDFPKTIKACARAMYL
jgi:hypothetical protein